MRLDARTRACTLGRRRDDAGYAGKNEVLDEAIARFSMSYADQAERDHADFMKAIRKGRIEAQMEH